MDKDLLDAIKGASKLAMGTIQEYFASPQTGQERQIEYGLILLGRLNGAEANRIKEVAVALQVARAIGITGDPLRPLLEAIAPTTAASAPVMPEGPGALARQ